MIISGSYKLAIVYATFIVWLLLEFSTKQSSCYRPDLFLPDVPSGLTQRGIPLNDCADCYTLPERHGTRQGIQISINRPTEENAWESVGEIFLVGVVFVAATSWAVMISIFINDRVQNQINRRLNMVLAMQLENNFGTSRKKG